MVVVVEEEKQKCPEVELTGQVVDTHPPAPNSCALIIQSNLQLSSILEEL